MFSVLLKSLCRTKLANTSAARPKTPRSLESWQLLAAFELGMLLDRFSALILEQQMCWWNWLACYHTSATTPMWWKSSSWSSFIPTFILISISTSTPTSFCSLFKELFKKRPEAVCPSQDPGSFSFLDSWYHDLDPWKHVFQRPEVVHPSLPEKLQIWLEIKAAVDDMFKIGVNPIDVRFSSFWLFSPFSPMTCIFSLAPFKITTRSSSGHTWYKPLSVA